MDYIRTNIKFFHATFFYGHNGGKFDVLKILKDVLVGNDLYEID